MKNPFTPEEIDQLLDALRVRDAAEIIIQSARKRLRGRNKTHAMRRALGLCPECGTHILPGAFYCDICRDKMTARHRKNK